jgi:Transposase DDE domain
MAIISAALDRIKSNPLASLGGKERVNQCFTAAGHLWRDRVLDPANTMALFILQVLHGNTAITHLRLLWKIDCADSSYCDARTRLPVAGVAAVVETLSCDNGRSSKSASQWLGRRVLMSDATTAAAPDTPKLQKLWPQPTAQARGCGFPIVKLLALLDLATGMILQLTMMSLKVHEMSQLAGPHGALRAGDVLLGDRAFCSFGHLVLLGAMSVDAVFRMHQRQIIDFTPGRPSRAESTSRGKSKRRGKSSRGEKSSRRGKSKKKKYQRGIPSSRFVRQLGHEDQIVEWKRPAHRPVWMTDEQFASQPEVLRVRELRYRINARGMRTRQVTVATTLLDEMRYPKREIARLYGLRWEIETNFRHLKTTMKMEHLKCQTPDGVAKELMVFALVYNLIRAAMVEAAERQAVDDANRMSFIDALRYLQGLMKAVLTGPMPKLKVNPIRPGRYHPRVKKRRMKEYDLMNKPRSEYPQPAAATEFGG